MLACALVTAWARRRFLEASIGAIAVAWRAPGERVLGTVPFVGEGSFPLGITIGAGLGERRALDLSILTPGSLLISQERFFVRTGCPDRLPPTTTWNVRVHGLVERPVEVDLEALKREAAPMGTHLLECAGNSRAAHFGFMSAARWGGVPLERVLARVRRRPRGTRVLVSGFDEHEVQDPGSVPGASWIFGLDQIRESGAFLATEMNGAPLSPDHGYPLRLVVPGWYGCTAIKWVNEIALVDDEAPATDHMREYAGRTGQDPAVPQRARDFKPASIDPAAVAVRVDELGAAAGRSTYQIVGIVWGGRAPVRHLGIRLDPNVAFAPVDEIGRGDGRTWALWSHRLPAPASGRHRIELAIAGPGVRTRRLDTGFYAREIEIA
jgi:DMSO/TMAO reductase YedYZ molybdopterin-dependent catalytic subunit